jgi:hypothetical protein
MLSGTPQHSRRPQNLLALTQPEARAGDSSPGSREATPHQQGDGLGTHRSPDG